MSEDYYEQLKKDPLYVSRADRAKANKAPSKSSSMGTMAEVRYPNAANREDLMSGIMEQDKDLVQGSFANLFYKPVTINGVNLKLEPVQPSIGTIVHGIDLSQDLKKESMVTFLRELWLERRVLLFRNQNHLSRQDMVDFAGYFGEVGRPFGEAEHVPNSPYDLNQQVKDPNIPNMLILPSDENVPNVASNWHCDATWQKRPPMASILMCREAPPIGGDTCFCDCYAMWEGLSLETKKRVEHLNAVHVGTIGHQMDGVTPEAVHPVARTHPETGKTVLYVQQGFVRRFAQEHQVPEDEEKRLLLEMKLQEGRPEYTCRVKWEPGSLAMWDNRAVLHCASGDFWPHRRLMERLTILDFEESRRTPYYRPSALQPSQSTK